MSMLDPEQRIRDLEKSMSRIADTLEAVANILKTISKLFYVLLFNDVWFAIAIVYLFVKA